MIRVKMDAHAWTGDRVGSFVRQDVRLCISSPVFWSYKVIVKAVSRSKISGELFASLDDEIAYVLSGEASSC
jgi:hypothetical protein